MKYTTENFVKEQFKYFGTDLVDCDAEDSIQPLITQRFREDDGYVLVEMHCGEKGAWYAHQRASDNALVRPWVANDRLRYVGESALVQFQPGVSVSIEVAPVVKGVQRSYPAGCLQLLRCDSCNNIVKIGIQAKDTFVTYTTGSTRVFSLLADLRRKEIGWAHNIFLIDSCTEEKLAQAVGKDTAEAWKKSSSFPSNRHLTENRWSEQNIDYEKLRESGLCNEPIPSIKYHRSLGALAPLRVKAVPFWYGSVEQALTDQKTFERLRRALPDKQKPDDELREYLRQVKETCDSGSGEDHVMLAHIKVKHLDSKEINLAIKRLEEKLK